MTVEISGATPLSQNIVSPAKADSSPGNSQTASAFILARILEGGDVGNHLNKFHSLSRETDPELFYEGLYNLGVRLEQSGQVGVAASVYSFLANGERDGETVIRRDGEIFSSPSPRLSVSPSLSPVSPVLQQRAQERLAALRGEGSVGLRLEVLGRTFVRQAMAPAPLIGMGVAGLAFRGMNLFAATRLANLSAGLLTRGPGLRILSGLAGFAAEVPAFTLTGRVLDRLLTGNVGGGWTQGPPLLEEMASAALVLGSLKLFGAAFGQLGNRMGVRSSGFGVGVLQQAGMLTGIMAGHGLEVAFGLRERQAPSLFLAESLVTLAQFNVAGRLSHSVFGERYERLQRQLAMQTEVVGRVGGSEFGVRGKIQRIIEQMRDRLNGPPLAGATMGGGRISEEFYSETPALRHSDTSALLHPDTLHDGHSYMVGKGSGTAPLRPPSPAELKKFTATLRSLDQIAKTFEPNAEISFLLHLSKFFHQQGWRGNAREFLSRAGELAGKIKDPRNAANHWMALGETHALLGQISHAVESYQEAAKVIRKLDPYAQVDNLSRLGILQSRISDPTVIQTFAQVGWVLNKIPSENRDTYLDNFARRLIEANEAYLARRILDDCPRGRGVYGKSDLALYWAKSAQDNLQHLTYASVTFREAQSDILSPKGNKNPFNKAHELFYLADRLHRAGKFFREEHREVLRELHQVIRPIPDPTQRQSFFAQEAVHWAKVGEISRALSLIKKYLHQSFQRSRAIRNVAVELAKSRRFQEALQIVEKQRLFPEDRFWAYLELYREMKAAGMQQTRQAKSVLAQARKEIEHREFFSSVPTEVEGLAEVARFLGEAGMREEAWKILNHANVILEEKDYPAALRIAAQAALVATKFELLDLSKEKWGLEQLFNSLHSAAVKRKTATLRRIATLLGFHEEGFFITQKNLHLFPEETRSLIKACLYYGASLKPRSEKSREHLSEELRDMLAGVFHSTDPYLPKTHLITSQALKNLSPNLLQMTLHEGIRSRLKSEANPRANLGESWLKILEFDSSDRIFYQSLSLLARLGIVTGQALVHELMKSPQFPRAWKPPLERALKRRSYHKLVKEPKGNN